ncbi:MAG: hypothetical protein ACXVBF_03845 [Flavisolibacter sp.]
MTSRTYILKLTGKQQVLVLLPFLLSTGILFLGGAVIFHGEQISGYVLAAVVLSFILIVLPVLILHFQYLVNDFGTVVLIDPDAETIEFRKKGSSEKYQFKDITSCDYYATVGHISKKGASPAFYSFDSYRFYKLKFSNNKTFYITCLLMNNIENKLEGLIKMEADWRFRALPLLY